jgi:hypothetical protein
MGRMMLIVAVVAVLMSSQPARAAGESYGRDAGYGTLAVVTNVLYMPVKLVYAGLGAVTGALAYVLTVGNTDVAESVWSPSLGGTYVVTPAMLRGDEELLFSGPSHQSH